MAALNNKTAGSNSLYSAEKLLEWSEYNLIVILGCIGLDPSDLETSTIEDLIERIETIFGYGDNYPEYAFLDDRQYSISAAAAFNKRQQRILILNLRRFWRLYGIAKYEVGQNV